MRVVCCGFSVFAHIRRIFCVSPETYVSSLFAFINMALSPPFHGVYRIPTATLHDVTTHKTSTSILSAVKTSILALQGSEYGLHLDSSVGIALGYGLDDRGSRVRLPAGAGNFSLHHRIQNGSGAHSASYPMGTRGSILGVKRPGCEADHSPPSSAGVKERVELYLHSPNMPSWCGAQLKHRTALPFTFYVFTGKISSCSSAISPPPSGG
jgi:hypothetical protein